MTPASIAVPPHRFAQLLSWKRVRFTLGVSAGFGLFLSLLSEMATIIVVARTLMVGFAAMLAFGVFELP